MLIIGFILGFATAMAVTRKKEQLLTWLKQHNPLNKKSDHE